MALDIQENVNLAKYTTLKVGGEAECFAVANTRDDLIEARKWSIEKSKPLTVLGWASNSLISDKGIKGLVIINRSRQIEVGGSVAAESELAEAEAETAEIIKEAAEVQARLDQNLENSGEYYSFADLDYDESDKPRIQITFDSGVPWQMAINFSIQHGATGLQFFSGIPGTVGGAVVNNIHGGSHFISEFVTEVEVINEVGDIRWLPASELEFAYDYSRFHHSKEIILRAKLNLYQGDKERAQKTSIEWARRKRLQPARSAGCTWQNITDEQKDTLGLLGNSVGFINDQVLGLKGHKIGGAWISEHHAAFIQTEPGATASDVYALIKLVEKSFQEKFGITPKPEIFLLGEFE